MSTACEKLLDYCRTINDNDSDFVIGKTRDLSRRDVNLLEVVELVTEWVTVGETCLPRDKAVEWRASVKERAWNIGVSYTAVVTAALQEIVDTISKCDGAGAPEQSLPEVINQEEDTQKLAGKLIKELQHRQKVHDDIGRLKKDLERSELAVHDVTKRLIHLCCGTERRLFVVGADVLEVTQGGIGGGAGVDLVRATVLG